VQLSLPFDSRKKTRARLDFPRRDPALVDGSKRVVFIRHRWARRYILRVLADGTVRVTLPRWGAKREAQALIDANRAWIERERATIRPRTAEDQSGDELLRQRARRELPAELLALAQAHSIPVARVSIRNQRSRWGACSASGTITLNWRLIQVPGFVREYVMLHELMHRRELNHSKRFWRLVAACCPRFVEARRWLRKEGKSLW
jgi:predicted metal-dependent hydrolase